MSKKYKKKLDKKASVYWFIYAMAFLFMITIMYIIFNQILRVYIYPTTVDLAPDISKPDKWLGFWGFMPFIIVFIISLYMWIKTTSENKEYG